jgi:hypothetical protein
VCNREAPSVEAAQQRWGDKVPAQPAMAIIDKTGTVQTALGAVEQSALDQALTAITS